MLHNDFAFKLLNDWSACVQLFSLHILALYKLFAYLLSTGYRCDVRLRYDLSAFCDVRLSQLSGERQARREGGPNIVDRSTIFGGTGEGPELEVDRKSISQSISFQVESSR